MLDVIIPVSLSFFLGPGAGQLYNREFRKATYLIILSFVVFFAAAAWLYAAASPYIPTDLTTMTDRAALLQALQTAQTRVIADHGGTFYIYKFLLVGTWLYGVIDAYRGGQRRMWMRRMAKPKQ